MRCGVLRDHVYMGAVCIDTKLTALVSLSLSLSLSFSLSLPSRYLLSSPLLSLYLSVSSSVFVNAASSFGRGVGLRYHSCLCHPDQLALSLSLLSSPLLSLYLSVSSSVFVNAASSFGRGVGLRDHSCLCHPAQLALCLSLSLSLSFVVAGILDQQSLHQSSFDFPLFPSLITARSVYLRLSLSPFRLPLWLRL